MMRRITSLLLALLVCAVFLSLSACNDSKQSTDTAAETVAPAATEAAVAIDEEQAKLVALDGAGITEAAAKNLTVEEGELNGEKVYVVKFSWSGYEYEYSISKTTGELVQKIFDGDIIN